MLTPEQAEIRKNYLGASEISAILGLSPWATPADVWLRHTGQLDEQAQNAAMAHGNRFEPVILDWLEETTGRVVIRGRQYVHPNGAMIATLDGQIGEIASEIVEAKYTSVPGEWGADGSDEIPDQYHVQIAAQFACVPTATVCRVPVMLPGFRGVEFRQFIIERDNALVDVVESRAVEFMNMVRNRVRPLEFAPSIDVLKIIRRQMGKTVSISAGLVQSLRDAKASLQAAENAEDAAKSALITALGDAEFGDFGERKPVTYRSQTRTGLDTDAIKRDVPDWKRWEKISKYPVLRLPEIKD